MIPTIVYLLCTVTSIGCAALLWRHYRRTRLRLLFWSALCFAIFALANVLLFVDLVLYREGPDLLLLRTSVSLLAVSVLLYGLVFESQ
jgi:hypothetical protein